MLGRKEPWRGFTVVVLSVALAGCLGAGGGEELEADAAEPPAPDEPDEAPDRGDGGNASDDGTPPNGTVRRNGSVAVIAGAGVAGGEGVASYGEGARSVEVTVPENTTQVRVYANQTDDGVDPTGPGAGFLGFELRRGGEVVEAKGELGRTSYAFALDDPEHGPWTIQAVPHGVVVGRQATVTWVLHGPGLGHAGPGG